jgi:hypothetical protein
MFWRSKEKIYIEGDLSLSNGNVIRFRVVGSNPIKTIRQAKEILIQFENETRVEMVK